MYGFLWPLLPLDKFKLISAIQTAFLPSLWFLQYACLAQRDEAHALTTMYHLVYWIEPVWISSRMGSIQVQRFSCGCKVFRWPDHITNSAFCKKTLYLLSWFCYMLQAFTSAFWTLRKNLEQCCTAHTEYRNLEKTVKAPFKRTSWIWKAHTSVALDLRGFHMKYFICVRIFRCVRGVCTELRARQTRHTERSIRTDATHIQL